MPIYEYRCAQCSRVVEILQKVGARGPRKCERCSGPMHKIVSRSAFHLKGGGWFSEGYTAGGSAKAKKPAADPASGTKPESKKDKKDKKEARSAAS